MNSMVAQETHRSGSRSSSVSTSSAEFFSRSPATRASNGIARLNNWVLAIMKLTSIFSEKISPANDGLFVVDGLFVHEGLYVYVQLT